MPKRTSKPKPVPVTLTQQKADFTAEGAPPPGKVSTLTPVTAEQAAEAAAQDTPDRDVATPSKKAAAAKEK